MLEGVKADISQIKLVHPEETIELLRCISFMEDVDEQEHYAAKFDAVYFDKVRYFLLFYKGYGPRPHALFGV